MKKEDYKEIIVESFLPEKTSGRHGKIHVRPIEGQSPYETDLFVECSKELISDYPVGTKFRIKAKLTQREDGAYYVYSHYKWSYVVLNE